LLLVACTGSIDIYPYGRACREIECGERPCRVPAQSDTTQEAISNQRGHATHAYLQSPRLRKQARIAPVLDGTVQKVRIE
jgi:hypothetical protein